MARTRTNPTTGRTITTTKERAGKLTTEGRLALDKKQFALPPDAEAKASGEKGSYPIPDAAHARNALARVAQHGTPAEQAKVKRAVAKKFPGIEQASER